jgi:hypothetical protein
MTMKKEIFHGLFAIPGTLDNPRLPAACRYWVVSK